MGVNHRCQAFEAVGNPRNFRPGINEGRPSPWSEVMIVRVSDEMMRLEKRGFEVAVVVMVHVSEGRFQPCWLDISVALGGDLPHVVHNARVVIRREVGARRLDTAAARVAAHYRQVGSISIRSACR